jgi:hypothetical protein
MEEDSNRRNAAFIINFVGVLLGVLVLALSVVKYDDFKDNLLYLQIGFFLSVFFLFLSILFGFLIILNLQLYDLFVGSLIGFTFPFDSKLASDWVLLIGKPTFYNLLINCMYFFFGVGLLFVALIIVLMIFKSLLWDLIFLILIFSVFSFALLFLKWKLNKGD